MHEHLDEMGVIHMNGRIYDPLIGRFMSADPFIPDASNLQAHNRFAYVYNNPVKFTDPDGFKPFWKKKWFKALAGIAIGWWTGGAVSSWIVNSAGTAAASAATVGMTGAAASAYGAAAYGMAASAAAGAFSTGLIAGMAGGFMTGLVASGGDLSAALQGAFSGGVFGGIGSLGSAGGWSTGQYVAAHAAGGCITSVASGGQCGSGALSAAFGKFTTLKTQDWGPGVAQFTASVVAGGVGSVIGGGKFESGAMTGAYAYMFNNGLTMLRRAMFGGASPVDTSHQNMAAAEESLRTNAQAAAEGAKLGVAVCGVGVPACRGADFVFSAADSAVAAKKGDWSVAAGNAVGFGVGKWAEQSVTALKFYPQQFAQGVGYVYDKAAGKLAEYLFKGNQEQK